MKHLRLLYFFFKPHLLMFFFLTLFFAFASAVETISIGSVFPLLNGVMNDPASIQKQSGKLIQWLFWGISKVPTSDFVVASCIFILFFTLLSNILGFIAEAISHYLHLKFNEVYLWKLFLRIFDEPYSYFLERKQGEILYLGLNASKAVGEVFHFVPKTLIEVFKLLSVLVLLVSLSFRGCIALGAGLLTFTFFYYIFTKKITYPYSVKIQTVNERISSLYSEMVAGIRSVKILNSLDFFGHIYDQNLQEERRLYTTSLIYGEIPGRLVRLLSFSGIIGFIIVYKVSRPADFSSMLPVLVVYLLAIQRMIPSIHSIGTNWIGLKELLPRLELIHSKLSAPPLKLKTTGKLCPEIKQGIAMESLSFAYPSARSNHVLNGLQLTIPANRTTAIAGPSGAGKTTLVDLLAGLYSPSQGRITVDGVPLEEISTDSWLNRVAMLSQEPFLFHATIRENILIGKPGASATEIEEAARLANAHDFILQLPEGYGTKLGDRGTKLSGGQRQRIALAQALIRKPNLLIMDEATSALDNISEKAFQDNLQTLRHKLTIVMIAHRLSTVEHADQIVVLDQGAIAEKGTHHELLEKNGLYSNLYRRGAAEFSN